MLNAGLEIVSKGMLFYINYAYVIMSSSFETNILNGYKKSVVNYGVNKIYFGIDKQCV